MRKATLTILPLLSGAGGVQVRVQAQGLDICTEGDRESAVAHAIEELRLEPDPYDVVIEDLT